MKTKHKPLQALFMAAGCIAVLVAILTLTSTAADGGWGLYLLLLLCPAIHLLMHRRIHHSEDQHKTHQALLPAPEAEAPVDEQAKLTG